MTDRSVIPLAHVSRQRLSVSARGPHHLASPSENKDLLFSARYHHATEHPHSWSASLRLEEHYRVPGGAVGVSQSPWALRFEYLLDDLSAERWLARALNATSIPDVLDGPAQ